MGNASDPRGQTPEAGTSSERGEPIDTQGRPVWLTEMSPSGWASGGNEETFEAGLPFLAGLVVVVALVVTVLLILTRRR